MPDIFEKMWAMNVPSSDMTDLTKVTPFRISTIGERLMMRQAVEDYFNLPEDGFVENPWGFPFIPLPVRRSVSTSEQIIAPESISFEGLGHPIFWIDPALTRRTDEERKHPERWSIRMFYLIMALRMFNPETTGENALSWYNVPRSQGIEYDKEDWLAYRQGTSSALGMVKVLTEADLIEPLAAVHEQTENALAKCAEIQSQVWATYRAELSAAYNTAVVSTSAERSEWDLLNSKIEATTQRIVEFVKEGVVPSSMVSDVFAHVDELERIVTHTERSALLMSIPVLRSETLGDQAAAAATALNASNAALDVSADALRAEASRLFELSTKSSAGDFVRLHQVANAVYMKAWQAMMVAARNLVRAAEGNKIYQSWEEYELVEDINRAEWPSLDQVLASVEQ